MESFDIVIIGAGPAGLFAAIHATEPARRVCVLEKNGSAGLKLLLTGAGKCNLTHAGEREDFLFHYGDRTKGRFVKPAFYNLTNNGLCRFFEEHGLKTVETDDGKIFPEFMRSRDVLRVLVEECANRGVEVRYQEAVESVARSEAGFLVATKEHRFNARYLVIATGGKSYPQTGSTGDGYGFAETLGHSIVSPAPALSSVRIRNFRYHSCAGISLENVRIILRRDGNKIQDSKGDVLFTHSGLSGPGILDMSRNVESGDTIGIGLVNFDRPELFEKELITRIGQNTNKTLKSALKGLEIPDRLLSAIGDATGLPFNARCSTVEREKRRKVADTLMELKLTVEGVNGFDEAMATRGGVALGGVNASTMESRKMSGLYFAGEVLDVDGDTGGYNLQFAFSSGSLVGKKIE